MINKGAVLKNIFPVGGGGLWRDGSTYVDQLLHVVIFCDSLFFKKKFGPPENFFFGFFSRFRPFLVDLDQKKIFKIFFPPGRDQPPSLPGGKNFWKFFFGLNRLKMVWNVKKSKKNSGGPGGGRIFFFKRESQKITPCKSWST